MLVLRAQSLRCTSLCVRAHVCVRAHAQIERSERQKHGKQTHSKHEVDVLRLQARTKAQARTHACENTHTHTHIHTHAHTHERARTHTHTHLVKKEALKRQLTLA